MSAIPYWTEADQAEWDALLYALCGAGMAHKDCAACRRLYETRGLTLACPPMTAAIGAVIDWRRMRALLSRAEYLRAELGT